MRFLKHLVSAISRTNWEKGALDASCLSVRLTVRTDQRSSHCTDFRGISYWRLVKKICRENPDLVKMGQEYAKNVYIVGSGTKYFVGRQQNKLSPLLHLHDKTQKFLLLTVKCRSTTTQRRPLFSFHDNNGYVNAPQRHILRTFRILFEVIWRYHSGKKPNHFLICDAVQFAK
jgi:hypothetical protein